MAANHIPGLSLAVVRAGTVSFAAGYGTANLELSTPATEKTVFAIYSVTKPFTAMATMLLVEEGRISLDDGISKHLSGLPVAWNPVTVRQLLSHTSGIRSFQEASFTRADVSRDHTPTEVLGITANSPLDFSPGESSEYNNTAYFLLGMLIEKASGMTYAQFLRERIFAPLGMRDTRLQNHEELIPNRAAGYTWKDGAFHNAVRVSSTISFSTAGLLSTVLDLAKWDAALYGETLLKKSTLEQMWTDATLNNGQTAGFGLGFGVTPYQGHRRAGHSGGASGFAASISRFVDDRVTVIVLTNADSAGFANQNGFLIGEIANEIASYYFSR